MVTSREIGLNPEREDLLPCLRDVWFRWALLPDCRAAFAPRGAPRRMVATANVEAIAIPSTASRQDRDRLVRDFIRKAEKVQDGEVVLVIVRT